MKVDMYEAAAAVAANHKMGSRDVLDIARFALLTMVAISMTIALL